jgi:hypothetical protein
MRTGSEKHGSGRRFSKSGIFVVAVVILALTADVVLGARYLRYRTETARLREGMTKAQRERADAVVAAERHRLRVEFELIRRQARGDRILHLAINVDSGRMILERDGVVMRDVPVRIGPNRIAPVTGDSAISVPVLGQRTVERLLTDRDSWLVPASVYHERGLPEPDDRRVRGALGPHAILLTDGTVIYSIPDSGPLADSVYVLPGSVLAPAADMWALAAIVRRGLGVYLYK